MHPSIAKVRCPQPPLIVVSNAFPYGHVHTNDTKPEFITDHISTKLAAKSDTDLSPNPIAYIVRPSNRITFPQISITGST